MTKFYNWQSDMLKNLPTKKYGRKYEDKINTAVKQVGGKNVDVTMFKNFMDTMSSETPKKTSKVTQGSTLEQWNRQMAEDERKRKAQQDKIKSEISKQKEKPKSSPSLFEKKSDKPDSNWFIDSQKWLDNHTLKPIEKLANRFATNITDSMAFGQLNKNVTKDNAPKFVQDAVKAPKNKVEKAVDVAGQFAGMAAPIGGAYRATGKAASVATKAITKGGKVEDLIQAFGHSKGFHVGDPKKYVDAAVKGAAAMGAHGATRETIDEVIHPNDANLKQRAKNVALDTALGAVGDPAFRAAGEGLKVAGKALKDSAQKTVHDTVSKQLNEAFNSIDHTKMKPTEHALPNGETTKLANSTKGHDAIKQEFDKAVEEQYQYLKNSMGKGVDGGTTNNGLAGNMHEVTGRYTVSKNPKWYQDFYANHGRKPNNAELKQIAEDHVFNGFADEVGNLPPYTPKHIQELDAQIEEVSSMIEHSPDQEAVLKPILQGLEDDKASALKDFQRFVLNSKRAKANNKPEMVPEVAKQMETLPPTNIPEQQAPIQKPEARNIDTSAIDNEIESVTRQIEAIKSKPTSKTKTEIDDALRSLEINDAYLRSSYDKKKISTEEYRRKQQENDLKREALLKESQPYTHDIPSELNVNWNNETKAYELGDYSMKKAYGGGFTVKKGTENVGKFRTEEEAKQFMQESHGKERGINVNFNQEGVLQWKSTHNESDNSWDIQAGDYSIHRQGKDKWTVKKNGANLGTFKNEKKAREMAQRHFDSQPREVSPTPESSALEQRLNELHQQRESLLNPPIQEPVNPIQQAGALPNTNIPEQPLNTSEQAPVQSGIPKKPDERAFYNTVANSEKITPEMAQKLQGFDKSYTPMSNQEVVNFANKYVENDIEKAYQFVKNANKFDPRHIAVGHRLIDELQKRGEYDKALDVVERLAEQGTKAGQSIQSYSIYNRLSVEGQLLRAQRRVNQINADIADPAKQVKLTPETIDNIAQTADSIKRFTGQEEQANNIMSIMDNIKKGNRPTDEELNTIRSFVADAKKFVGDLTPDATPPKPKNIEPRKRDKVVNFMDEREQLARERLKKIMGRANSLPVDAFYELSVIGASKIAKGTVKVADFAEEMVKEFGDVVKPYINQLYDKAVETFNLQSETITRQRLSEVEKIANKALKDKNLDPDQAEAIKQFAKQVGAMSGDAKVEASMELQATLQALERPTFGQKLSAAQTIAQLLNPKTIGRNAIGNELFYRVEQFNKLLATPIDMAKSKITGSQRTVTFRSFNQGEYWKNWMRGAKAGWKGVNPMGLTSAYDLGAPAFKSKYNPLSYMEKALGATLRSFDYAGYMRAYNKTLGELGTLKAINEGLKGKALKDAAKQYSREADENMQHIADAYGKYATFQDTTAISNALTKVKKGMNKVSTLGATEDFGLGDLVLKYPKTPGNLIMRALEYSPAGLIRSGSILRDFIKTKNPMQEREMVVAFTRAITGTGGFSLLGYVLADAGVLTTSGNSDYEVSSLERNAGKQPNSVNVSAVQRFIKSGFNLAETAVKEGDTFVSYDWAQPISIAVALGTGVEQSTKESGKLSVAGAAKGAFDSASNTVIQQSVLKGLNDFLANYPGRTISDRVGDAAKGLAGSFVPTLSNQVRQMGDNASRSTYDPSTFQEIKNRAVNRIPGVENSLPNAYDTLGHKRQTFQDGSNNVLNVFFNPSFVSKYKPSPEAKFVLDYINASGDKSVAPRIADKKLDGKPLTAKQYAKMQKILGEETQKGLEDVVPSLEGADFETIRKELEKVLREAGKTAREEIRAERGD